MLTYVLETDTEFTRQYEVAAWHATIRVPAGEYPARFTDIRGNDVAPEDAYYVSVSLPGTIVSAFTPSLFGGVAIRGDSSPQGEQHRDVGQETTHHIAPYAHSVAQVLAEGGETRFRAEGVEGYRYDFDSYGKQYHTWKFRTPVTV